MNEEEQNYLASQVLRASKKVQEKGFIPLIGNENEHTQESKGGGKLSFGSLDACVTRVEIYGDNEIKRGVFESGSKIKVRIFVA